MLQRDHDRGIGFSSRALVLLLVSACNGGSAAEKTDTDAGGSDATPVVHEGKCTLKSGKTAEFATHIGCKADFEALASVPIDTDLPDARSVKVVLDQADGDALYFQNSSKYKIHYEFASTHLSGDGLPLVEELADFNRTEYYQPDRRFLLGAVTYYDGPEGVDARARAVRHGVGGDDREAVRGGEGGGVLRSGARCSTRRRSRCRPKRRSADDVPLLHHRRAVREDRLPAAHARRARSAGCTSSRRASSTTEYLQYRDIIVLDEVPNDISVVSGLITEQFQTPLSHVNVLSQNRGTPNMGLRGATTNAKLRALEGKWVELTVGGQQWSAKEVSAAEADAFWDEHKPAAGHAARSST